MNRKVAGCGTIHRRCIDANEWNAGCGNELGRIDIDVGGFGLGTFVGAGRARPQ
jgi:hypothetical protein